LATRIRRKYPLVKIVRSFEWQKNGKGIHIHALLCGLKYLPKDWIKKTWDKLESSEWSIQLEKVFDNPKRALGYLMKYMVKWYQERKLNITRVVNWALNVRSYGLSGFSSTRFSE